MNGAEPALRFPAISVARDPVPARIGLLAAVVLAGLAAWPARAQDDSSPIQRPARDVPAFSLAYVPDDAAVVVAVRPAFLVGRPDVKELLAKLGTRFEELETSAPVRFDQIEQAIVVLSRDFVDRVRDGSQPPWVTSGTLVLRTKEAIDWSAVLDQEGPKGLATTRARYAGKEYRRIVPGGEGGGETPALGLYTPDDRTAVFAAETNLFRAIQRGAEAKSNAPWASAWATVATADVAAVVDFGWARGQFEAARRDARGRGAAVLPVLGAVRPVWDHAVALAAGASLDDEGVSATFAVSCADDAGTSDVAETLNALRVLARNMASGLDEVEARAPAESRAQIHLLFVRLRTAAESLRVDSNGSLVLVRARSDAPLASWLELFGSAVLVREEAAPPASIPLPPGEPPAVLLPPGSEPPR